MITNTSITSESVWDSDTLHVRWHFPTLMCTRVTWEILSWCISDAFGGKSEMLCLMLCQECWHKRHSVEQRNHMAQRLSGKKFSRWFYSCESLPKTERHYKYILTKEFYYSVTVYFVVGVWDRVLLLGSTDWSGVYDVAQSGLGFAPILLPEPPKC